MASALLGSKGPCMGEPKTTTISTPSEKSSPQPLPPPLPRQPVSLIEPSKKEKQKSINAFRCFKSVCRSFPILTPMCKLPTFHSTSQNTHQRVMGMRVTGTLFGYGKGKVSLAVQENPMCLPTLIVELAMQTHVLQREMNSGMVRIALECEKRADKDKMKLIQEPLWTMYCNGKKNGYGIKRDASEEDLNTMELLKSISMGAGVLPGKSNVEGPDGEMAYLRAHFERIMGSKDSVTLYMLNPEGNNGPELSIFFVRI